MVEDRDYVYMMILHIAYNGARACRVWESRICIRGTIELMYAN